MSNYIFPVVGKTYSNISSGYGSRTAPTNGATTDHKGIDISTAIGTTVVSAASGKVTYTGWNNARGYYIKIDNGNGITTLYQHLSKIETSVGQTVAAGTEIAKSGNTGISSGPHLHFEVLKNGTNINPLTWLKNNGSTTVKTATGTAGTTTNIINSGNTTVDNILNGTTELSEIPGKLVTNWKTVFGAILFLYIVFRKK